MGAHAGYHGLHGAHVSYFLLHFFLLWWEMQPSVMVLHGTHLDPPPLFHARSIALTTSPEAEAGCLHPEPHPGRPRGLFLLHERPHGGGGVGSVEVNILGRRGGWRGSGWRGGDRPIQQANAGELSNESGTRFRAFGWFSAGCWPISVGIGKTFVGIRLVLICFFLGSLVLACLSASHAHSLEGERLLLRDVVSLVVGLEIF